MNSRKGIALFLLIALLGFVNGNLSASAQSVALPSGIPKPIENLKAALLTPNGLLMVICGGFVLYFSLEGDQKKNKLATGRWAGSAEKSAARKVAIRQIQERKKNSLTYWINAPKIIPLEKPQLQPGKPIRRFKITPSPQTIFIPDGQRGTAVCGAPGSGKTFSVIDPMIRSVLHQGMPTIVYDFKYPTQTECHAALAKELGYQVRVFAPGQPESEICNLLDFLRDANDAEMAGQIARVLNKNFSLNGGKGGDDPFFQMSGDQLIKAVLQLAKTTQYPDFLMCQKILSLNPTELIERLESAKDISPWVKVSFEQFMSMKQSEKTSASVAATASLMFTNFVSPDILPCLCGNSTIPLDLAGKQLLIFGMDRNRRDIIGPILATVLHMVITRNVAQKRTDPLAVFLDEIPTIALPTLVNWLNESRSDGFCGVLGYQNLTQLEKAYGREIARAILSGCNTKFVFNPGEKESAEYFSGYLDEEEVKYKQKSKSYSSGKGGGGSSRSTSDQERTKKLISPGELLRLPSGSCVLISPGYANKDEANIPLKLKVKIVPKELKEQEKAQQGWEKLVRGLRKRSKRKPVLDQDIHDRLTELNRLFPPPAEPEQGASKKKPRGQAQTVLEDLMQSAAAAFDEF